MPSEAVMFRKIDRDHPTLFLDEVDAIYGKNAGDAEALRAVLNAGYRRGLKVPRCAGKNRDELVDFDVFGPKCFAAIGRLPKTIADRSIDVPMGRRTTEPIERWRIRETAAAAAALRERLHSFLAARVKELRAARPAIPEELDDRAAEGWEALLAIADLAGGTWPEEARKAAKALSGHRGVQDSSLGVLLLNDIFGMLHPKSDDGIGEPVARVKSADLIEGLCAIEASPWGDWHGRPITPQRLSKLLEPFGVKPKKIRFEKAFQGYEHEQFRDAWARYADRSDSCELGSDPVVGTPEPRRSDAFPVLRPRMPTPPLIREVPRFRIVGRNQADSSRNLSRAA